MTDYDYDLFVIGSGPAGQRAAIQGAKLNKRVAIAEKRSVVGGVSVNLGTIPSKTLREAVLYLSGYRERGIYGMAYTVKKNIEMSDLLFRADHVIRNEIDVVNSQFNRNSVDTIPAEASFVDAHTIHLEAVDGSGSQNVTAENIIIAVGTRATRDPSHRFRRPACLHQRRHPQAGPHPQDTDHHRRRRHRRGIRQHFLRPGRAGDSDRQA